jgi:hypothetical protein
MSFFDSIPEPPPPEPVQTEQPAWMRSDAVIPGSVPGETLLVRTGEVAVAIGSVRGYPNGFEFTLHTRLRAEDEDGPDPFEWHGRRSPRSPGDDLRLGVMYADGRRAATTGGSWPDDDVHDAQLILLMEGSAGSDRRWDGDFWAHPLPPDGPVTFVASWLRRGVPEVRAELDGAAIRAAARRAVTLWADGPQPDPAHGGASRTIIALADDPDAGPA